MLDAGRKLKAHIARKRREIAKIEKKINILKYAPPIAHAIAEALNIKPEKIQKLIEELVETKLDCFVGEGF